ncbi:response regulator transcription factor [Paenibacillus cremeus]|uniref:response regulator transcription factor n=1 Tax=Paenibacillus cremeus TaxID=2163881 RepID=UPI0016472B0B|nr:helix-turn-helix domain-containing protein [Paenibacillus cremeus]
MTGHNDFDYVYQAIQSTGVSYLLKSEGYEKIIHAVTNAIAELESSLKFNHLIQKSEEKLTTLETLAQGSFFQYLFQGTRAVGELEDDFRKLGISLDPTLPVLIALGDLQHHAPNHSFADRQEAALAVKFLSESFLAERAAALGIIDRYGDLIWLIQPIRDTDMGAEEDFARTVKFLEGKFELLQHACTDSMQLTVSITLCCDPCDWKKLSEVYDRIRREQHLRAGDGTQMVQTVSMGTVETAAKSRSLRDKAEALAAHLDSGRRGEFLELLEELGGLVLDDRGGGGQFFVELYFTIALLLLSYINRWELHDKVATISLMRSDMHTSWYESFEFLKRTAESLFDLRRNGERNRAAAAIGKVRLYIDNHIGEDLSLVRLAKVIHFNPSYLSRLFKQECGLNLSEYIEKVRIEKARELLKQDELKIAEVGVLVGYEASHSFTRFFKKTTGVTPQEYRDAMRK